METVLMWRKDEKGGVVFAARIEDPPSIYDTVLGGSSPHADGLDLFLRVVQTTRKLNGAEHQAPRDALKDARP